MTNSDWWARAHTPPQPEAQRLEPVTLAPPLWTLTKNGHTATAHVRAIDGVGLELRFMIEGELRHSQISVIGRRWSRPRGRRRLSCWSGAGRSDGKKLAPAAASARGRVLSTKRNGLPLVDAYGNDEPEAVVAFEQLRAWGYPIEKGLRCHCSRCETQRERGST